MSMKLDRQVRALERFKILTLVQWARINEPQAAHSRDALIPHQDAYYAYVERKRREEAKLITACGKNTLRL